jgi:hypothetical protein
MVLIWLRYDAATLGPWLVAQVAFVARHAFGVSIPLTPAGRFAGWRFEPDWPDASFFSYAAFTVIPTLLTLAVGPLTLALSHLADAPGRERPPMLRMHLRAGVAVAVLFGVWFLLFDPTQWDRHLLPAIYGSAAMAAYCALEIAGTQSRVARRMRALALPACAAITLIVAAIAVITFPGLSEPSYARACRGDRVIEPPCFQDRAVALMSDWDQELCGGQQECVRQRREVFLDRAIALGRTVNDPPTVYTGGYLVLLLRQLAYTTRSSFLHDLTPHFCAHDDGLLWSYLAHAGVDLKELRRGCAGLAR